MTATSETDPVDLGALRTAAAPVAAWYEQFLAGRPEPLADLDHAMAGLRSLPPIGGLLGEAVALVATLGGQATTEEAIAALELLRRSAALRHVLVPAPPAAASKARRRPGPASIQPSLPGIEGR